MCCQSRPERHRVQSFGGNLSFSSSNEFVVALVFSWTFQDILSSPVNSVVQRYVSSPLRLDGKGRLLWSGSPTLPTTGGYKVDCRQLVLVTSYKPLTVYVWDSFYLRTASAPYDTSPDGLRETMAHICNVSIQKAAGATKLRCISLLMRLCVILNRFLAAGLMTEAAKRPRTILTKS